MATKSNTGQKALEAILGRKLAEEEFHLIPLIQSIAVRTEEECIVVEANTVLASPNYCHRSYVLDISGYAITGSNGQSVFRLTSYMCPAGERFSGPINVVVTPYSTKPRFLTVNYSLVNNGADVEIKVFAWLPDGSPAASVTFHWRCRVLVPITIK